MNKLSRVLLTTLIVGIFPLASYAFNLGDRLGYTIFVNNQSPNTIIANGQSVPANTGNFIVSQYTDVIQSPSENFVHAVTINSVDNQEICTVTGHVEITVPGSLRMFADDTNLNRCNKSNGIYGGMDKLGMTVTVMN